MLEKLMQSPVAWAILSMITIISLVIAIYSLFATTKKKEISYDEKSYSIVRKGKNMLKDFELLYKGNEIPNITVTQYAIWNSGNQLLSKADFVADQPLRVFGKEDAQILDAYILTESEESNKFSLKISENTVWLDFDYVAVNEGIVLQVIHTDSNKNLFVAGKIKGGKPLKEKNPRLPWFPYKTIEKMSKSKNVACIALAMCIFILATGVVSLLCGTGVIAPNGKIAKFFFPTAYGPSMQDRVAAGIAYILIGSLETLMFIYLLIRIFKIGIPSKLRGYSENVYFD